MNSSQPLRRQNQPVQIGARHGYRIEGDHAFINAELHVPLLSSGGDWTLELWACEQPYQDGALAGVKVAELVLELPTPIAPYVHHVDTMTAARVPLQGRAYAMVLALVEHDSEGQLHVHAFANYPEPQTFSAPHFEGKVGYRVDGDEVVLEAEGVFNPRPHNNLSGSLSVELWAFPEAGPASAGLRLASSDLEPLSGGAQSCSLERRVAFSEPPFGRYQLALQLREWTFSEGYVARDRRHFDWIYEHAAPEAALASEAQPALVAAAAVPDVAAPAEIARPVERLRLVPPVSPVVVAKAEELPAPAKVVAKADVAKADVAKADVVPTLAKVVAKADVAKVEQVATASKSSGLVSIQTASVEELAKVKGLNLKIAKEIVKARPFASLADLIRVRGVGQKTMAQLKGLLTL